MKKWLLRILYAALALTPAAAIADYSATQGSGSTVFAFVCSTTKICPAMVLIDSTNVEKATAGNPLRVDPTGTTTQPVSASALPLPTGAATAANQTNKNQFTQLTDGTNAAATYTAYGTAPTGNVPGANVFVTNTNANGAAAPASASPVTPSNQPVGSAAFAATQVSVGSTATSILSARTGVAGTGRVSATVTNTTTTAIYLGGAGVTTSTGQLLPGIVGASVTINTTAAIFGIVATGSATVTALETF